MAIRRILADLVLASLANPKATANVPLVITPTGALKRQETTPAMTTLIFGAGPTTWVVPAGVTSIQIEAQAGGGGSSGGGESGATGSPGGDGANTEIYRNFVPVVSAQGGKGGAYAAILSSRAGQGGFGGAGGVSYRGADGGTTSPFAGGNAGVSLVDAQKGAGGSATSEASSGGGGGGGRGSNAFVGFGGGGGEYIVGSLTVTPGESLLLRVGAGGAAGMPSSTAYYPGRAGGPGFLILRW
ncbi:MAG: hypothetical protein HY997_03125 [Mycolicibacterium neoaurum]|nr:hypothetical protein [Mycolicibacterium neoaurum]